MQTIKHNKHTIVIYDSIDEMPIKRFHMFNRLMLIESGVGSDLDSFDRNLGSLLRYIKMGDKIHAAKVIENMRQNVNFIYEGVSPGLTAFVALIYSIDGKELTDKDMTSDGAQDLISRLDDVPVGRIRKSVDNVKKKWKKNLRFFFQRSQTASI